jgi:RNA polymerase sigma-70 factor, ECF subfamily
MHTPGLRSREANLRMSREAAVLPGILAKRVAMCAQPVCSMSEEAFCTFYYATAPSLQGYIRRTCGNTALAEDILQEAFYRFLRADLPKMGALQMKAYIFKIATSLLVDHWRRLGREKLWKSIWSPQPSQSANLGDEVTQALRELKPVERALLWLAYVEGFDHGEIASTLGLKEKSIRVLLYRARKKMARVLGRQAGNSGGRL